jgi:hypothetical protein
MKTNSSKKPIIIIVAFWTLLIGGFMFYVLRPDIQDNSSKNTIEEITSSPFYDVCLSEAAQKGNEFLNSQGYITQPDGSFVNSQGEYPTFELEDEEESLMTDILFDCLEKYEKDSQSKQNYVAVQYRKDSVNLDSSYFEYLNTSKSSFIEGAWYDKSNSYLIMNINGKYYHYCETPKSIWAELQKASSFGSYYNANIKGNYDCREHSVPSYN